MHTGHLDTYKKKCLVFLLKANFRCRSTETCPGVTETCIHQTVSKIQENCRLSSVFHNKNENCVISSAPRIVMFPLDKR